MVELGVIEDAEDAAAGSGFGVRGGIDQARDAGLEDGSGTHGAGLEGCVEGAVFEAIVVQCAASFTESNDLGVGGGVGVAEDTVLASADDSVFMDYDCAHRNLAVGFCVLGFGYGGAEVGEVFHYAGSCWERQWRVPKPQTRSTAWMPTICRLGKQLAMMLRAWRSLGSLKVGTRTRSFAI